MKNIILYVSDTRVAAVMLVRGDVMVEVWGYLWAGEFGVEASSKVWLRRFKKQRNRKDDLDKRFAVGFILQIFFG